MNKFKVGDKVLVKSYYDEWEDIIVDIKYDSYYFADGTHLHVSRQDAQLTAMQPKPHHIDATSTFKVGDWVKIHYTLVVGSITKPKYDLVKLDTESNYDNGHFKHSKSQGYFCSPTANWELWTPQKGDWCWFGQRLGKVLDVFTVQGKTKVKSTVEYPVYVMNGRKKELYETRDDWNIDNVEPFIGQLPSWIKE